MTFLVPLPVVIPLLGAAITLLLSRRPRAQRTVSLTALSATLLVSLALLVLSTQDGALAVAVGGWGPLGIVLVADQLAALMLTVSSAVTLCVLVYSIGQGMADGAEDTPLSVYHPTYLILTAGVTNAFLSGDLFNLYVGFEILLVASYVLLTLGSTENRIRAGTTYVVVSLLSSLIFLTALGLVYAATGTLNMAQLVDRLDALPDNLRLVLQGMLLLAFGIKAAVFPLSSWLPDSYPTAPAPVTAVFAGLLTKVGVYAIIRTETLLFPGGRVADLLLVVAFFTMVVGILGAVAQSDIKRLLSFTLISHIGYLLLGIGLSTTAGLSASIFYTAHHIVVQTTLFLVAGLIELRGGSTALDRLGGLGRLSPLLGVLFLVPALNLAGIPPFSGFLGKVGLFQAAAGVGGWLAWALVAGGAVTSLLTLYAIARVWNLAFWRVPNPAMPGVPPADPVLLGSVAAVSVPVTGAMVPVSAGDDATLSSESPPAPDSSPDVVTGLPAMMVAPTIALVALGVALTVAAGPLFGIAESSAEDLIGRDAYVRTVAELPEVGQ